MHRAGCDWQGIGGKEGGNGDVERFQKKGLQKQNPVAALFFKRKGGYFLLLMRSLIPGGWEQ